MQANGAGLQHELDVYTVELEMQNEALQEICEKLETSRAEYRELFDFSPLPYLVIGEGFRILTANIAAAELLGTKREDLVGVRLSRFIAESDAVALEQHKREVLVCKDRVRARLAVVDRRRETHVVVFESMCTDAVAGEWRTALVDMTENNALARQLEQSERLSALGNNVGSVVHDIRNMITTMSAAADLALRLLESNSRAKRPLEQLKEAGARAGHVLGHLLAFAEGELTAPESHPRAPLHPVLPRDLVVIVAASEPTFMKAVCEYLRSIGCEAFEAASGFEALEVLKTHRAQPAAILVDPRLRSLGKPEFAAAVRSIAPTAGIVAAPVLGGPVQSANGETRAPFEQIRDAVVLALSDGRRS